MSDEAKNIETQADENNVTTKETIQLFNNKEYTIALLRNILKHGYSDLLFSAFSGISIKEIHAAIKKISDDTQVTMKDRPSIIHWLRCGLFESTETCVPLALLFIEWYEQHPSNLESEECNFRYILSFTNFFNYCIIVKYFIVKLTLTFFSTYIQFLYFYRELYHFLYKVTMNKPVPSLSHGSAKVLHALMTDIAEEVWPNSQQELLKYLTKVYNYNKPNSRRMYPGKRTS